MSTNLENLKLELKNRFNSTPSGATLSSYVATILIAQALKDIKEPDPVKFYQSLLLQKEVKTRNGNFEIKDRFVQFPMVLRVIKDSGIQDLSD